MYEGPEQRQPELPRKSPKHLLFLPLAFAGSGVCCYFTVKAVLLVADVAKPESGDFDLHSEAVKTLIVLLQLLASIPVGLILVNLLIWFIPPLRRFFEAEALAREGASFRSAAGGLLKLFLYGFPLLFVLSVAIAVWGK